MLLGTRILIFQNFQVKSYQVFVVFFRYPSRSFLWVEENFSLITLDNRYFQLLVFFYLTPISHYVLFIFFLYGERRKVESLRDNMKFSANRAVPLWSFSVFTSLTLQYAILLSIITNAINAINKQFSRVNKRLEFRMTVYLKDRWVRYRWNDRSISQRTSF